MPPDPSVKNWPVVSSRALASYRIFSLRNDLKINPRTGGRHDFFVLECPDWVNVVAVTRDARLVMVEQFRHGTNTVELEIPGGVMDPHETDPVAAGQRELREETGYRAARFIPLGEIWPAPGLTNERMALFLATDLSPDPLPMDVDEAITVEAWPLATLMEMALDGRLEDGKSVVTVLRVAKEIGYG